MHVGLLEDDDKATSRMRDAYSELQKCRSDLINIDTDCQSESTPQANSSKQSSRKRQSLKELLELNGLSADLLEDSTNVRLRQCIVCFSPLTLNLQVTVQAMVSLAGGSKSNPAQEIANLIKKLNEQLETVTAVRHEILCEKIK